MVCIDGVGPGKDLALFRLKTRQLNPLNFGYPIFALAADYQEQMSPGNPLKVVGYGETEAGTFGTRMKTEVPVLSPDCLESPYEFFCAPFQEMILADRTGSRVPRDTCAGDSGGPVYVRAPVSLPSCVDGALEVSYENQPDNDKITVLQDVLVAVTSRAAPFTQALAGGHCGGGAVNTLIGRQSVYAWFDANHVRPQKCVHKPK